MQQVIAGQDAQRAATTLLGRLSEAASGQDGRISSTDAELVQVRGDGGARSHQGVHQAFLRTWVTIM